MNIKEEIFRKLRSTVEEFGQVNITPAIIIGNVDLGEELGGHKYIYCPTINETKLANTSWEIARFFEDI